MPQTEKVIPEVLLEKQLKASYNVLYKMAQTYDLPFAEVHALLKAQNFKCAITGVPFDLQNPLIISRVNASKSYQINNVMLCLSRVHHMRGEMSFTEFKKLCRWVISGYKRDEFTPWHPEQSQAAHS